MYDKELHKYAGNRIKELRESHNMTQDDLAYKLNTTHQAISRYETGQRGVKQDLLFKLADVFNVSINTFFPNGEVNNDDEINRIAKFQKENDLSELDEALFSKAKELTDEEKRAVITVMNAIKKDIDEKR